MQTKEFKILVYEFDTIYELPEQDREIVLAARKAAEKAYAPYSEFRVGAALRLANDEILSGNNQENSTFTVGLCAERVALFYANANFPEVKVKSLAITAKNDKGHISNPVSPCGACRQVLHETELRFNNPIRIILDGKSKIQVFDGVENLLPFAFKPEILD